VFKLSEGYSQIQKFYRIPDSLVTEFNILRINDDCDTSEFPLKETDLLPISYGFLDSNGFCYNLDPIVRSFTMSFTFTAASSTVFINTGYSIVACTNVSFTNVSLFDNTNCVELGNGFYFNGLIPGNTYTWSVSGESGGIFCEGFSDICPYYVNIGGLPIELISFTAVLQTNFVYVKWITGSETNVNYFMLERTNDLINNVYVSIYKARAKGNSSSTTVYEYVDQYPLEGNNYYRIKEVDNNGDNHYYYPIVVNYKPTESKIIKVIDLNGKTVDINTGGYKIIIYENGTSINKYIIK